MDVFNRDNYPTNSRERFFDLEWKRMSKMAKDVLKGARSNALLVTPGQIRSAMSLKRKGFVFINKDDISKFKIAILTPSSKLFLETKTNLFF